MEEDVVAEATPASTQLVPLAANLPWAFNYISFGRAASGWWLPSPTADSFALYLTKLGAPLLLVLIPVAAATAGQRRFPLAALLWLVPIVGALIVSQIKPVFLDRYLIVIVPAQLLLLAPPDSLRMSRTPSIFPASTSSVSFPEIASTLVWNGTSVSTIACPPRRGRSSI